VHSNIGTILLGRLGSTAEVGTFAAAYRVIALVVAAVGTVSGVLYPRLASLFEADRDGFATLIRRARKWSLAIGLPLALATAVSADRIVAQLFGAGFAGAARSLEVLAWFIPLFCLYSPLSSGLLASGAEVPWLVALALGTGIVVAGSLGLVPALGHVGGAWALVGSGVVLVAAVGQIFRARGLSLLFTASDLKMLCALATMGLVLWQLRPMPVLGLLASSVAYGGVLHLTGFLTEDERRALGQSFAAGTRGSRLSQGKVDGRYQGL
jgi:O-antigen/teichoic acid export membrane protein